MRARLIGLTGIITIAVAGLLVLTGCPEPQPDGTPPPVQGGDQPATNDPGTATPGTAGGETGESGGETAAPADATAGSAGEAGADGEATSGETASLPQPTSPDGEPQLEGEWFALFGRTELGPSEHLWFSGHRVNFRSNGQAIWMVVEEGAQTASMDSQWGREGQQLKLSFMASKAVESGLSGIAPMGIGKDEEIGLASGQAPGGNSSAMNLYDALLDYSLDHNYLVLTDANNNMYVYGRVEPQTGGLDTAAGEGWYGWFNRGRGVQATVTEENGELTIEMGSAGRFSGHESGGYVIGRYEAGSDSGYAALIRRPDGEFDGAIMRKPYRDVEWNFEFVRSDH
jgi:hypothetical protein